MAASKKWSFMQCNSDELEEHFTIAAYLLGVEEIRPEQKDAIRAFLSGKDLYYSAPTGSGKSLIFQCIPILIDLLKDQAFGTSTVLVISPLVSLMQDQVKKMAETAVSAAAIFEGQAEDVLEYIANGEYSLVYTSPEAMLESNRWRSILSSDHYRENCEVVVVDEAHCIVHWGTSEKESGSKHKVPFRHWYGKLQELRSLLQHVHMAVFTATVTKSTRRQIFDLLQLNPLTTQIIEQNPVKDNLRFAVRYVENDQPLCKIFAVLIAKVKSQGVETPGTIIFCRTRKQCSSIFRIFAEELDKYMYVHENEESTKRLVEMYHAGTPDSVKNHILETVTNPIGHIRVLICTIAFGMGIDCSYITQITHFGGSKCIETYLQECGRAGRRDELSTCTLIYNGRLMKYSNEDMKNYAFSQDCRRKSISFCFSKKKDAKSNLNCACCDICAKNCSTQHSDCLMNIFLNKDSKKAEDIEPTRARNVSRESRKELQEMLCSYRQSLLPDNLEIKPVSYPNMYLEFSSLQVCQTMSTCHLIFNLDDVRRYVEIWREQYASNILAAIHHVFNDFDIDEQSLKLTFDDVSKEEHSEEGNSLLWDDSVFESCLSESLDMDNLEMTKLTADVSMVSEQEDIEEWIGCMADEIESKINLN